MKRRPGLPWAGGPFPSPMTSDNNFPLILRRLNEIERKLDRILEELQTPTTIGYSVRRGIIALNELSKLGLDVTAPKLRG